MNILEIEDESHSHVDSLEQPNLIISSRHWKSAILGDIVSV